MTERFGGCVGRTEIFADVGVHGGTRIRIDHGGRMLLCTERTTRSSPGGRDRFRCRRDDLRPLFHPRYPIWEPGIPLLLSERGG